MSRIAAAVFVASLCLTASAGAANVRNPLPSPDLERPSMDRPGQIEIGEPFVPKYRAIPGEPKTHSYEMSCVVGEGHFPNGSAVLMLKNTGAETIPAGSIIVVTYPDGTKKHHTTSSDIKPGAAVSIMGPLEATPGNFPCLASAKGPAPYVPPVDPTTTNAPSGNANLPPKLACEFTIVDGKLVVTFKNVGGSPLPAKQFLHAGVKDTGIGASHYLQQDMAPGDAIHLVYEGVDPSFYVGADCVAKIMD